MKKKIIRSFKKKHNFVIKKSKFILRHPFVVPVISFFLLFFTGLIVLVLIGSSTGGPADAKIVNIFADGEQRTVTTRAKNVDDLLTRLGLVLADEDIVEPALNSPILEDDTQINVYRSRSIQLIDGDRTVIIVSAQRAPRLVAAEAGIKLYSEDKVSFERSEGNVLESSVAEQLVIDRSIEVQLNVYSAIKKIRTTANSVGELLKEQDIAPHEGEIIQPRLSSPLEEGMLISVNSIGVKTVVANEPIAFEIVTKNDETIEAGKTQVQQTGVNGERAIIYEIEETDGIESARKIIQEVVLITPVSQIELRGTKILTPYFDPTTTVSADKIALMSAAGIAQTDYAYVDFIVSRESGWRPGANNAYSGAYGLCQSLPASKMATAGADYLTNPVTQLRWCSSYALRYGGWAGAYAAWQVQHWW